MLVIGRTPDPLKHPPLQRSDWLSAVCMQLGSLEEYTECLPAGSADDCQFGLTQSHVNVWKALAASDHGAAWVFECVPSQT